MKVILQRYRNGCPILKSSQLKPREEVFTQALLGMKVSQEVLDGITIVIKFRFMIPDGGTEILEDNKFKIYLRSQKIQRSTLNDIVDLELKHIAIEIRRPHKFRTDGKKKGPYKWEELDCTRAEKKWEKLEYFEVLTTGEVG